MYPVSGGPPAPENVPATLPDRSAPLAGNLPSEPRGQKNLKGSVADTLPTDKSLDPLNAHQNPIEGFRLAKGGAAPLLIPPYRGRGLRLRLSSLKFRSGFNGRGWPEPTRDL